MAFYVYIVTNRPKGVLYTGMTDDLARRTWEHLQKARPGYAAKYNCRTLVWFEAFETREAVFQRERRIKEWKRAWKIELIEKENPDWRDLSDALLN